MCTIPVLILLVAITSPGCFTLAGTGIGALTDVGGDDGITENAGAAVLTDLEIESKVTLTMRDSSQHYGIYWGLTNPDPESTLAEARRRKFCDCSKRNELRVGDSVTSTLRNGKPMTGLHFGSFRNGLRLRQPANDIVTFLPFADLSSIQWCGGTRMLRPPFDAPYRQGMLDFVQSVRLNSTEGLRILSMRDVMSIHYPVKPTKSGWLIGLLIGLSADIALVLSLSSVS